MARSLIAAVLALSARVAETGAFSPFHGADRTPACALDEVLDAARARPRYPLLVTGASRSGTHLVSSVLLSSGLDVPHEMLGADGSVSWLYGSTPTRVALQRSGCCRNATEGLYRYTDCRNDKIARLDAKWADDPARRTRARRCEYMTLTLPKCDHPCLPAVQFESVCHLVREPLATLRSCLSEPSPAVHYADGVALRLFDAQRISCGWNDCSRAVKLRWCAGVWGGGNIRRARARSLALF